MKMTATPSTPPWRQDWIVPATMIAVLLPWAILAVAKALNPDTLWLAICADRLLDGQAMAAHFYDNNPPLSVLLYVPPVALSRWTGMSTVAAIYGYMALLTLAGLAAMRATLRCFDLSRAQAAAIVTGYLLAATVLTSIDYTERDQILFMGLAPLAFIQVARTKGYAVGKGWLAAVGVAGGFMILLKPAFVVVPALLQAQRAWRRRSLKPLFDTETWLIGACATAYVAMTAVWFPDFVSIVLPDVAELYLIDTDVAGTVGYLVNFGAAIGVILLFEARGTPLRGDARLLMTACYALALLCLVPFALQMKGFSYQLIPAGGFFFIGLALSAVGYVERYADGRNPWRVAAFIVGFAALAYIARPPLLAWPSPRDYRTLPLAQEIHRVCGDRPCGVYHFGETPENIPTEFYTGSVHASRFGSPWFLPPLAGSWSGLDAAERARLRLKYATMTGEDLAYYRPDILLIEDNLQFRDEAKFDFVTWFSAAPAFTDAMRHYRPDGRLTYDRGRYYGGTPYAAHKTLSFDVYRRVDADR